MENKKVIVVGGGLAGCECAFQLARAGHEVVLYEMRPDMQTGAHETGDLAELVCSNSLRSNEPESGPGLLKQEMRQLGSILINIADSVRVPAGKALAVDRKRFSDSVTRQIETMPGISVRREEIPSLEDERLRNAAAVVIAAGPLASEKLSASLAEAAGSSHLYFYDAIAPIVAAESLDSGIVFPGSRYHPEEGDYLNCPLSREEYEKFYDALIAGETVAAHMLEEEKHFEGCMPIEALAARGKDTLVFGPFRPVGFIDPRTGRRPHAVVQLRAENADRTAFNLVGCQTKLRYGEQKRIFRCIPGLENAEFLRLGSMHRNTYVNAPVCLTSELALIARPGFYLAGQITGVEGYVESAASGLWTGLLLSAKLSGRFLPPPPPPESALGALLMHLRSPAKNFQPSNIHFGLMPAPEERVHKKQRKAWYVQRAEKAFSMWRQNYCQTE